MLLGTCLAEAVLVSVSPAETCGRCHKEFDALRPLPTILRRLMVPARIVFHVFDPSLQYCPRCRRALLTPTIVLIAMALGLLSIGPLRFLGIIR